MHVHVYMYIVQSTDLYMYVVISLRKLQFIDSHSIHWCHHWSNSSHSCCRRPSRRVSISDSIDELLDEVDPPGQKQTNKPHEAAKCNDGRSVTATDKTSHINGKGHMSGDGRQPSGLKGFQPRDDARLFDERRKGQLRRY